MATRDTEQHLIDRMDANQAHLYDGGFLIMYYAACDASQGNRGDLRNWLGQIMNGDLPATMDGLRQKIDLTALESQSDACLLKWGQDVHKEINLVIDNYPAATPADNRQNPPN